MARVEQKVAAKDYPAEGISKGDTYYTWQLYKQPVRRSKTPPRPSQLTGSDKLSRAYEAQESLQDRATEATEPEELCEALTDAAEAAREVAEEYEEAAETIEETFPNGNPTSESCREKAEALTAFADECDDAKVTIEALDLDDYAQDDEEARKDALMADAVGFANEPSLGL